MADPRFFTRHGPIPLRELAARCGLRFGAEVDGEFLLTDVAPLEQAGPSELSFFDNPKYLEAFQATGAGACIVAPKHAEKAPAGTVLLLSPEPYKAYARAAQCFYPAAAVEPGRHPTALVDASASIGEGTAIAAGAVIEAGAEVGRGCRIGPHAVLGRNIKLGKGCSIGAHASLSHCIIGDRVTLYPGVRIGQDGFGFAPDPAGHVKVPQLGRVIIGDDCEIGANTCIDRGSGPDTVIGAGTWIDNLVQIGHNVQIGRGCIIVSQVGISGSSRLGDYAVLAGQVGVAGHLRIGAGAQVAAQSGVTEDVPAGETWYGYPAMPMREFLKQVAMLRRMVKQKGKST